MYVRSNVQNKDSVLKTCYAACASTVWTQWLYLEINAELFEWYAIGSECEFFYRQLYKTISTFTVYGGGLYIHMYMYIILA